MIPQQWNKKTYQEYLNYLKSISEEQYKIFHSKLCFTKYKILGIRLPILRKIAKDIYKKTNYQEFLKLSKNYYYEEIMIEGLVIASIEDESLFNIYFDYFISKIDNWAICDSFCNSLKIVKKDYPKYFEISKNLSLKDDEFISRVGIIIILNFYIQKEYLQEIFKMLDKIKSDKYYVNMAEAWLICEMYIKYPIETEKYLLKNNLSNFTFNKSISKIRESYQVTKDKKDYLNTLKRK